MRNPIPRRILAAVALWLLLSGLSACRGGRRDSRRKLPTGISIEFADEASPVPAELVPRLSAMGVRSVFAPAVRFGASGPAARFEPVAPPDNRYGFSVYLVVRGDGDLDGYLKAAAGRAGIEIWNALAPAMSSGRYGEIAGVQLDLRVANAAAEYASALGALRSKLPRGMTLSAEIDAKLSEDQLKKWRSVGRQVDFLVPVVYGRTGQAGSEGRRAAMSSAEAAGLAEAVFPAFSPQGWGLFQPRDGQPRSVSDGLLNDLSEDRRFDFEFGSLLSDADENVYVFRPRQPGSRAAWGPEAFAPGDTVTFWENRLADFTQSLSDPLGAKGKIIRLRSLDDQENLIGFSVIEDILMGRRLEPKLTFGRSAGSGEVTFMVLNSSPECSELSRLNNWIDLRMEGGRLLDIRPGDFDRFEFLDSAGKQSVAGRARTIRFFENFIAPGESMTGGPIRFSGEAEFFASAHVALPDGRVLTVAESPVTAVPGGELPSLPAQSGRGVKRSPGR